MAAHNELGKWGEQIATDYLKSLGWQILHNDWKYKHKDLDVVGFDPETQMIVFVEVKTRSSSLWGEPSEAITLQKKVNIINAATAYLYKYDLFGKKWRYDSICIVGTPETTHTLKHNTNIANVLDKYNYYTNKHKRPRRNNGTWGTMRWGRFI